MSSKYYVVEKIGIDKREMTEEEYNDLFDRGVVFDTFEEAATAAIFQLSSRIEALERKGK